MPIAENPFGSYFGIFADKFGIQQQHILFERLIKIISPQATFHHTRLYTEKQFNGSGIGLAICRKIMTGHKGTIIADGSPDIGIEFTMNFPRLKME